ncbi:MAG: hypothetical protein L3K17_06115, partial [Thermoplasmata archaeon]|nr:hypothetical protein [Thermoplasmata archaeon]
MEFSDRVSRSVLTSVTSPPPPSSEGDQLERGGSESGHSAPWRHQRKIVRGISVVMSVIAALIVVTSAMGSPPTGHFYPHVTSGPGEVNATVNIASTYSLTFTGGSVNNGNPQDYYKLFWFFGEANASKGIDVRSETVAPPAGCVLSANCTGSSTGSLSYAFNRTGSFEVSVTLYDAALDYQIYTFTVNVEAPRYSIQYACHPTLTQYPEGQIVEYWAQAYLAGTAVGGLQYLWNWGDGTTSPGRYQSGCFGGAVDGFAQHRWTAPGTYQLEVTAWSPATGEAGRSFTFINITNPGPTFLNESVPTAVPYNVPFATFANVTDYNYPELANETVVWNFGDGPNWYQPLKNLTAAGCTG